MEKAFCCFYDRELYKARHLIENSRNAIARLSPGIRFRDGERFFAKLKQYRAIATRYDKTARNFLGAIHLAASVIWLN